MTPMTTNKLRGFPLGALQVFAPIRLGKVPDCSQGDRSLGCHPSASPSKGGSSRIRGTVRPEAGQHFRHPLVPGGALPEMFFRGVACRAPRGARASSHKRGAEVRERGREWKFIAK